MRWIWMEAPLTRDYEEAQSWASHLPHNSAFRASLATCWIFLPLAKTIDAIAAEASGISQVVDDAAQSQHAMLTQSEMTVWEKRCFDEHEFADIHPLIASVGL